MQRIKETTQKRGCAQTDDSSCGSHLPASTGFLNSRSCFSQVERRLTPNCSCISFLRADKSPHRCLSGALRSSSLFQDPGSGFNPPVWECGPASSLTSSQAFPRRRRVVAQLCLCVRGRERRVRKLLPVTAAALLRFDWIIDD